MQTLMSKSEFQHVLECHIMFMKCHTSYVLCVVSIDEEVKMRWSEDALKCSRSYVIFMKWNEHTNMKCNENELSSEVNEHVIMHMRW